MRFLLLSILFTAFTFNSFSQNELIETQHKSLVKPATSNVMVKLNNASFKQFELVIPGKLAISSVRFGTTSFCMSPAQKLYFSYNGENHFLLAAPSNFTSNSRSYNLPRLIKKRKKELGLK